MKIDILISGFGGQGIVSLGKIIAQVSASEGRFVTCFPSYGAEMRGGTAHCFVRISDSSIASPFIEKTDAAIILNQPSLDKFGKFLKPGSILIFNEDLKQKEFSFSYVKTALLPLNEIALECGNVKAANTAALGALFSLKPGLFKKETIEEVLRGVFSKKATAELNLKAFCKGMALIDRSLTPQI